MKYADIADCKTFAVRGAKSLERVKAFAGRGAGPYQGFSAGKVALDAKMPSNTPRRTSTICAAPRAA